MQVERWGLKAATVESMRAVFRRQPGIEQVILYGSRAKGTYQPGSDIDLSVQGALDLQDLLRVETELDDLLLPYQIDICLHRQITDEAVLAHIFRVGQVFYSRNQEA